MRIPSVMAALAGLALLSGGCAEPTASESGPNGGAPTVDLTGSWHYTATQLAGSVFQCADADVTVELQENALTHTLTGTASGAPVECRDTGDNIVVVRFINRALRGSNSRAAVELDFGCWENCEATSERWLNTGQVEGDSIVGTVDLLIYLPCICPYMVTGVWKAVRDG